MLKSGYFEFKGDNLNVANVVIASNTDKLDKKFSYIIPDGFCVKPGIRVLVPFGRSDKTAMGIVTDVFKSDDVKKLKSIISLVDEKPLCTEKLLEVADFIYKNCMCSYYSALRLVVASGANVKTARYIVLNDKNIDVDKISGRSAAKKKLLNLLIESDFCVDYGMVMDIPNISNAVKSLVSSEIITLEDKISKNIGSRKVRMVSLKKDIFDDDFALLKRKAPKQCEMIELLKSTGDISVCDLVTFTNGSYTAVNSLFKKGLVDFYEKTVLRTAIDTKKYDVTSKPELTHEQRTVCDGLICNYKSGNKMPNLIRGVTGSGKTEVFLQVIDYFINLGKQAIVLVPEISLTPQMVKRFVGRFGERVSVLHSGLSAGEKFDEWQKILNGDVSVVIGARSAVFAPFSNLGIIIIDEEHETTYKSDTSPRYDAREVALFRAENEGAMLVMASATPSVNSYFKAKSGIYNLFEMKNRYNSAKLPDVNIVDMRLELKKGNRSVFSERLVKELEYNIKNRQQSILFINRRGFNSFVMCRSCGETVMCRNCSVSMTYHKRENVLKCHYCGYTRSVPSLCPNCESPYIRFMGTGTEKVEEELASMFGKDSFIRMDQDTTMCKNSHETILRRFGNEKIPILLGTQMVTKGLDFKDVTLVGVLLADIGLNVDDFRAFERTFCQLTQVCGRAGRGDIEGRAVVQTYQPEHYAINLAKNHNYDGFYENEIKIRQKLKNPPFSDIILLMMTGDGEDEVFYETERIARRLKAYGIKFMGPVFAPHSMIKNKYRCRIIIKHKDYREILGLLHKIFDYYKNGKNNLYIDINPNSLN